MRFPNHDDFSREQLEIYNLPLEGSYLVTGPPGTGKTVMAVYRAEMLAQKGANAHLLVFSRLLRNYIATAIDELDLDGVARTYWSWLRSFWQRQYKRRLPEPEQWKPDWQAIKTTLNKNPPPANSIPFLILDEAQDLPPDFFMVAGYLAKHLTVFADENQKLFDDSTAKLDEIQLWANISDPRFELSRNYRNTREIAQVAARFYTGLSTGIPELPTRQGEKPVVIQTGKLADAVDFIARYERNNASQEIGVLVPRRTLQRKFVNRLKGKTKNEVQFYDSHEPEELDFDVPGIKVVNYQSAKGLEFDTVFLPELQAFPEDPHGASLKMRFYVLTSRARTSLYFMYSGDDQPALLDLIPADLLERT